jgi:hypothetical protein
MPCASSIVSTGWLVAICRRTASNSLGTIIRPYNALIDYTGRIRSLYVVATVAPRKARRVGCMD